MKMHIHARIPTSVAIRSRLDEAGEIVVPICRFELEALTDEQRELLIKYAHCEDDHATYHESLLVSAAGWKGVVEALDAVLLERKHHEERERKEEEESKERERLAIEEYLATPSVYYEVHGKWRAEVGAPYWSKDDPRVKARLDIERVEIARRNASNEAEVSRLEAEKTRVKQVYQTALREAALAGQIESPRNVCRAASEGRDISNAIADLISGWFFVQLQVIVGENTPILPQVWDEEARTDVPSERAYELLDLLKNSQEQLARCIPHKSDAKGLQLEITIGPIMRFDAHPKSGHRAIRTGIRVAAKTPLLDDVFEQWVLAEPLNLENEDDEN
jgi:hypothetical protein